MRDMQKHHQHRPQFVSSCSPAAMHSGHVVQLRSLCNTPPACSVLHTAAELKRLGCVKILLDAQANPGLQVGE